MSNHPGTLLRETRLRSDAVAQRKRSRYEDALAQHHARVQRAAWQRDLARAEHRWSAWLRGVFATRRERRRAPEPPHTANRPDQEGILMAGVEGEQLVARSTQQIACMRRTGGTLTPTPLPQGLLDALLPYREPVV